MPKFDIKDFLFIIPARKNSKGIKNKNFLRINKKYLIEYTFDKIKNISFNKKFILTDSKFGKYLAKKYNINCSYIRPKYLSLDHTSLLENIIHFDNQLGQSIDFKYYVILQPTSPLRTKKDIFEALKIFNKKKLESLYSISPSFEHPYDTISINKKKTKPFQSKNISRRQLYPKSFYINGAIYVFNKKLLETNNIISKKKHGYYIMKKISSLDLDDYQDLEILRKLMK